MTYRIDNVTLDTWDGHTRMAPSIPVPPGSELERVLREALDAHVEQMKSARYEPGRDPWGFV